VAVLVFWFLFPLAFSVGSEREKAFFSQDGESVSIPFLNFFKKIWAS
jgi:hypothetical protein